MAKIDRSEALFCAPPSIRKSDITFVVSGKISLAGTRSTQRCLASVRRFFPSSPIILSTWVGEPAEELDTLLYDKLLLLQEPAETPVKFHLKSFPDMRRNSINLQQFSVHAGMAEVSTRYAVRLRTDYSLASDRFLKFYQKWAPILVHTNPQFRVFKERVLTSSFLMPDARLYGEYGTYYLSDCFQFGRTEDLLDLWDGHQEPYASLNFFEDHPDSPWENPGQFNSRYRAEQYFFLNILKKEGLAIPLPEYYFDHSTDQFVSDSEKVYAANIILGNDRQLGLRSKFRYWRYKECITLGRLMEMYLQNSNTDVERRSAYLKRAALWMRINQTLSSAVVRGIYTLVRAAERGIKAGMKSIFPVYRVCLRLENSQSGGIDSAAIKLDAMAHEQRKLREEIHKLKSELEKRNLQ